MSLSSKLSITDVDLKGKRVLIRVSQQYMGCNIRGAPDDLVECF
jgi:hypothetical protein